MIRLFLTFVACVALQPAAPAAARGHGRGQATIAVGGGARVALPARAAGVPVVALAAAIAVAAPSWSVAEAAPFDSHRAVARLWLRGSRLLC